ncbi:5-formyltetrahydrofolate cyclo-ligase [Flavobacterium sedimenticola]|uniref:5-formyltetrahydrofolate cyclo-ligase n=1 Tax=Flavobacterium sedimenticola TaxID=3043286 RepID=A0ABT6XLS2_9FLAO|nr:5-formyltetrahydrofolate cyclo-ligase [Flavobacterium sedimenticola]MDI9255937.1 5-formyltetrahydrofolate cyclo-ligase [Flavobacterium sedimenticola]
MFKKELRKKYKALRQELTADEIEAKSLAIANRLLELDATVWSKTYFHLFLSIEEQKEVDTEFILQILAGKDKDIVVAKSHFETRQMTHYLLTDNTKFQKNEYNIYEPVDGIEVPTSKIEVVFVPLLAYDTKGNRVGYGKGFYDIFLAQCSQETLKIGLSFFEPEDLIDDVFEADVTLDYCVTPEKVYNFQPLFS